MTPLNRLILLGISTALLMPATIAGADEPAAPAEVAEMLSRQVSLDAKADEQMLAWSKAADARASQTLASRTNELLRQHARRATRKDVQPPASPQPTTTDRAPNRESQQGNTTCAMVGHTLECVLRDGAR
jgi:hypothetical protein